MRKLAQYTLVLLFLCTTATAEEVRINHQGMVLNANLERGSDNWTNGSLVLMTHGTLAHRGMEIMATLQEMLSEREVSSLAINLSLGLDDRPAAMYPCPTPHTHKHTDAEGEIGVWLKWAKNQGVKNILLLGHSRGGNQTARFAAANPDPFITRVVLIAPQTWEESILKHPTTRKTLNPEDSFIRRTLSNQPLLYLSSSTRKTA